MKKPAILFISLTLLFASCDAKKIGSHPQKTDFSSLQAIGKIDFLYASKIKIDLYNDYSLVTIADKDKYLVIPEGQQKPGNIPSDICVLEQPLDNAYLVSTSVMDFISRIGAMDKIKFTGTKEKDWYIKDAVNAMKEKKILYAGKYNAPDYENLVSQNCSLAIENTMIYHKPEVKEKLQELGIPVLVEYSGYETDPLGRLEWIKLYGHLFNKSKEAEDFFSQQVSEVLPIINKKNTGQKVAFFYCTTSGVINVRKPSDYISRMISLAGGTYAFDNIKPEEDNALSTINMSTENFYASAVDADIIIYNGNISGEIKSMEDLLGKNVLFKDFKAVKDKKAYSVGKNLFQETTAIPSFIKDLNMILAGNDDNLTYINKLD